MKSPFNFLVSPAVNIVVIFCLLWFSFVHGKFYIDTDQIKLLIYFGGAAFIITNKVLLLSEQSESAKSNKAFQVIKTILPILMLVSIGIMYVL